MDYIATVSSPMLYLIVGGVLLFIALGCLVFIVKSYKAGVKMGMEKNLLNKTITSSALFTILPSISILLGVIALSGSLGVPVSYPSFSWYNTCSNDMWNIWWSNLYYLSLSLVLEKMQ